MTIFLEVVLRLYSLAKFSGQNWSIRVPIWFGRLAFQMAIDAFHVRQSNTVGNRTIEWTFSDKELSHGLGTCFML